MTSPMNARKRTSAHVTSHCQHRRFKMSSTAPAEVDVFTGPHSRMKRLVERYSAKVVIFICVWIEIFILWTDLCEHEWFTAAVLCSSLPYFCVHGCWIRKTWWPTIRQVTWIAKYTSLGTLLLLKYGTFFITYSVLSVYHLQYTSWNLGPHSFWILPCQCHWNLARKSRIPYIFMNLNEMKSQTKQICSAT